MRLSDFDYALPPELIAQTPADRRDASRLLVVGRDSLRHLRFGDLPGLLSPGDLLVLNDTRVIKARMHGEKDSGGQAEIRFAEPVWAPAPGQAAVVYDAADERVLGGGWIDGPAD